MTTGGGEAFVERDTDEWLRPWRVAPADRPRGAMAVIRLPLAAGPGEQTPKAQQQKEANET